MEYSKKGWLYGIIILLSQTCNPDYQERSSFKGGYNYSTEERAVEIPDEAIGDYEMEHEIGVAEAPPPPPPPPPPRRVPPAPNEEQIFKVVEEMPRFPGCEEMTNRNERKACSQEKMLKFLYSDMKYPEKARKEGVEGTAIVRFAVAKDGRIEDVELLRDPGAGCGAEAIRVVKTMPKWIPGKQRGKAVKVQYNLPMKFKL